MAMMNLFKTTTSAEFPLDASRGTETKSTVSDFLSVQSFANFAAMTGAITAAWGGLQKLIPEASTYWVPYVCAFIWGLISILISIEGLKTTRGTSKKMELGTLFQAIFIAVINSLVLAGAVVGAKVVTS